MNKAGIAGWCLYDWANSAFTTVVTTFIFSVYFTGKVAADKVAGTSQWSLAIAAAGFAILVLSPALGAIADRTGRRKPWLALFTALSVAATASLWHVRPDPAWVPFALVAVVVASIAYELAGVFYNAMLIDLAPPGHMGRVSGWGWGVGYF
ncbi:MAG TPA: MFS transporter, partial [Azospirillaceae bacterium]|nr:MFS transporter [Azospirillaceae bacterium]